MKCLVPILLSNMTLGICMILDGCLLLVTLGIINPLLATRWLEKEQAAWMKEIETLSIPEPQERQEEPMIIVVQKPRNGGTTQFH